MSGEQGKGVKPLKEAIQVELKNLLSGFIAFAAAILILAVQGSLQPKGLAGWIGVWFMAASIPLGVVAYVISMKVLESQKVPEIGHRMADKSSEWALFSTVSGFMLILIDYSLIVFIVFLISCFIGVLVLAHTVNAWDKAELEEEDANRKEESDS